MKNFLLAAVSFIFLCTSVYSQIINVPTDQLTIQSGIDVAKNGDTVLVAEGLYYENINFRGKAITVASYFLIDDDTSHISATIIDGSQPSHPDSGSVVTFNSGEDTNSILCGFTITGGTGTKYSVSIPMPPYNLNVRAGGGITMFNSGSTICQNRIIDNNLDDLLVHECTGGGVSSGPPGNSNWVIIESNLITKNSCTKGTLSNSGGGLSISSNARVCGNTIRENQVSSTTQQAVGGGLYFERGDSIIVTENILIGNESITNSTSKLGVGGGMYFMSKDSAIIQVIGNIVAFNQSKSAAWSGANGVGFDNINGEVLFANNLIHNNYYSGTEVCHGGGIYVTNSEVQIINNTLTGNEATYGGGICNRYSEGTVYINNIFWNDDSYTGHKEIEVIKNSGDENPIINYCDIQGGWLGEGNIDVNPMFKDTLFNLSDSSRCIGRGVASYNFGGTVLNAPEYDFDGSIRPNPAGSKPDMGAMENERAYPLLPVIQIPDDYATIQAGIDAAENGDTVLVAEGTYYENVKIQNKVVTLASYFLIDGDTSHISKTIINGSQPINTDNGSVIMILDTPEPNTICGFTLTGGKGKKKVFPDGAYSQAGGGITIEESSAIIKNNHIINNSVIDFGQALGVLGGGIFLGAQIKDGLTLKISGNLISGNEISGTQTMGGGINISNYFAGGELDYLIEENIIENNTVINTDEWKAMGGGIFLDFCLPTIGNQTIRNNIIRNNQTFCNFSSKHSFGGGLYFIIRDTDPNGTIDNDSGPYVYNNIIYKNHSDYLGGGVCVWRAYYKLGYQAEPLQSVGNYVPKPSFINNTIVNNTALDGSGFYIMNHKPFLMNNILWNEYPDTAQWGEIFLGDEQWWTSNVEPNNYGGVKMFYNDVQGGWDADSGNIDYDPMFADTLFNLSANSYCIGNGIDSIEMNGIPYSSPSADFYGNIRPNPVDSYVDIGAFESPNERNPVGVKDNSNELPTEFDLSQNYPNPFNPSTTLSWQSPVSSWQTLKVYDVLGNEIETLVSDEKPAGTYEVMWDSKNYSSGVYFYQLKAGDFVETKKMILLR